MKVQIFSDLHVDVAPIKPIKILDEVDAVIVAGDTCEGAVQAFEHLRRFVPLPIPVLMVLGNHEYYRRFIPEELALARDIASNSNVHLLDNDAVVLGGIRFIGATLWTDYRVFDEARQVLAMSACAGGLNDHRLIGFQKRPWLRFRPQQALQLHQHSRFYLEEVLGTAFAGPTVVITHHAPHRGSIHPRFANDVLTAAFVSDLAPVIEAYQPALWVHGHVHHSFDYMVGATRVLCNSHGYGGENPEFNPALVLELGT